MNLKAKHTPGPWVCGTGGLNKNNCFAIQAHAAACNVAYTMPRVQVVKQRAEPIEPTEEDWANGKLIAAAPDLLNACKMALSQVTGDDPKWLGLTVVTLEEAIAKAEGRDE